MGHQLSSSRAALATGDGNDAFPLVNGVIKALWLVAGAAMLVFVAFLAVLIVAGLAFRLGGSRRALNSTTVFALSSIVVIISAIVLVLPGFFSDRGDGRSAAVAATPPATTEKAAPARIYPPVSGLPLRYAKGGASGAGLTASKTRALVLYGGADADAAELGATKLVNLVSHFGRWTARPVAAYRAGETAGYDAVFYLGGPGAAAPPRAFLDDVLRIRVPVMWVGDIGGLRARGGARWDRRYGFTPDGPDTGGFAWVRYKGTSLPVHQVGETGLMRVTVTDPSRVTVLGSAVRTDGTSTPWALRSGNLIYIGEDPLPYIAYDNDRYLAFADLLFEALAPRAGTRHRALVRLEDVGPTADPAKLRAVTDYLSGQGVPFSIGVYPVHRDPHGVRADGRDVTIRLSERPALVEALRYAASHGGTVLMHGYTHQYAAASNPSNGLSGEDAEFYLTHLDAQQHYLLGGPVPEDSESWALSRIDQGLEELRRAGLPKPSMFEFPHYMASVVDYVAAGRRFGYRYERSLYFPGLLSGTSVDDSGRGWQFFPYAVRDVYGATVVPENMDYVQSTGDSVPALLDRARANLVVRDGVASFFYHPFLGVGELPRLVSGIRAMGYTFVSAEDLVASP